LTVGIIYHIRLIFSYIVFFLDHIPLDWLYGETVVLDIPKAEKEPISAEGFENATPEIKEGDIVLVHAG